MNTAIQKLRLYEQMGFCKQQGRGGSWSKIRQPMPIVKRIIAFEAKLHDWKRAISQAYRYQRYANQAWVVLDASRAKGATRATEQFRRLNVGLKVLSRTGHSKTLVSPRFRSPKSPYHFWEANSLIAATLSTLKQIRDLCCSSKFDRTYLRLLTMAEYGCPCCGFQGPSGDSLFPCKALQPSSIAS